MAERAEAVALSSQAFLAGLLLLFSMRDIPEFVLPVLLTTFLALEAVALLFGVRFPFVFMALEAVVLLFGVVFEVVFVCFLDCFRLVFPIVNLIGVNAQTVRKQMS